MPLKVKTAMKNNEPEYKFTIKKYFCNKAEKYTVFAGTAILSAMFIYWLFTSEYSVFGIIAAAVSAALFLILSIKAAHTLFTSFLFQNDSQAAIEKEPKNILLKIFFGVILFDAALISFILVYKYLTGAADSLKETLEFLRGLDSRHYLDISREWYLSSGSIDRLCQIVFLPLYPTLVGFLNAFTGYDIISGLIVSGLCFAGAFCVLYRLLRLDMPHSDVIRTLKYLIIFPGCFFFAVPMTESLFLLLCVSSIYSARKDKWLLSGILGALCSFTRSVGLSLVIPLIIEWIYSLKKENKKVSGKTLRKAACILLVPLGFAAYIYINYAVTGDPFKFMYYQANHWSQHFGFFFNTAAYQLENIINSASWQTALGLWLANLLSLYSSLIIMILGAKKLRSSYAVWFICYYFVAMGATWLLSAPRYTLVMFPVAICLSELTKKKRTDIALFTVTLIFSALYLFCYLNGWQVW